MIKKSFFAYLALVVLGLLIGFVASWHYACLLAFIVGLAVWSRRGSMTFLYAFLAGCTVWGLGILFATVGNTSDLAARMAEILGVGSSFVLNLLVILLGGLLYGLFAQTGTYLRRVVQPVNPRH